MSLPPTGPSTAALVTGSSSGLGVALARGLAQRGYGLVLVARRAQRLRELADELSAEHGVRVEVLPCDLADSTARAEMLEAIGELGLDVEILVNNAGLGSARRFQNADVELEQRIVRVNVEAIVQLTGHFVPAMVKRGRGGVLNVASTTAFQPLSRNATYAASKAFLLSFTEALHTDLAGTGVTATALCPGPVKTELWEDAGAGSVADRIPGFAWTTPEFNANDGIEGLRHGKRVVVPGVINRIGALGGQHAPRSVLLRVAARFAPRDDD